jgi:hypothetical protein
LARHGEWAHKSSTIVYSERAGEMAQHAKKRKGTSLILSIASLALATLLLFTAALLLLVVFTTQIVA